MQFQILIDQSMDDPKVFLPWNERSKEFCKFFNIERFTEESINRLKSVPIEFLINHEEIPIGGHFHLYSEHAVWYDKRSKRYFGRKLDRKGYLATSDTAFAKNIEDVRQKLFSGE